ncbi:MAG: hypothetical protein JXA33_28065 [Anaerolineae bacterium]|nr:hypothetical protein [Anaerolineae bacterium]
MINKEKLLRAQTVKARYETMLMQKPNVVGVGVGLYMQHGTYTNEPAVIVNVTRKVPKETLDPDERIPSMLEDVRVQVQAIGEIKAQSVNGKQ